MTYRQLLETLQNLNQDQLDLDVCIYDAGHDEVFPATALHINEDELDQIDLDHPYIQIG